MINETTNFNLAVTVKDSNNMDIQVAYLNATLDAGTQNISINMNVSNKALVIANPDTVKQQYTDFVSAVQTRAKELGYVIF